MQISALTEHRCRLGEGPVWDAARQGLFWVDSLGPALYRFDTVTGQSESWRLPGEQIGSVAVRGQGGLILAMDQGFYGFDPATGSIETIAQPLAGRDGLRFNDGKVDPFGSFVAGGMNIDDRNRENCPMFRLTPEFEVIEILDGFHCFNGPCFSPDGSKFYVCGREPGLIEVFDYGREQRPRNGRPLLEDCNPDGATVDAEGYVWSAQWNDECLLRISAEGRVDARLPLPGHIVTSVMFGGPELDRIFVTTVGDQIYDARPAGELPGRILVVEDSGYRGRAEPVFAG